MTPSSKRACYPWVVVWGRIMGSSSSYVDEQCERAAETCAPAGAIFERVRLGKRTGEWATVERVTSRVTLGEMRDVGVTLGLDVSVIDRTMTRLAEVTP